MIEEIRKGLKKPGISRKEVLRAIASGKISPDVVEELEDAILVSFMEETNDDENVGRDEVMNLLSQ